MTHDEAIRAGAAERYVLREMSSEELDAFEEHFFDCAICAEDVRLTTILVDNVADIDTPSAKPAPLIEMPRVAAVPPAVASRKRGLPAWIPAAIAAALAVAVGIESSTIRQLREPRVGPVAVLHGESRGATPVIQQDQPLSLLISLEQPVSGAQITLDIQDSTGAVVKRITANRPASEGGISLFVPQPQLKSGRYAVVIGTTKYPFEVR